MPNYKFNEEKVHFEPIHKINYLKLFDSSSVLLLWDFDYRAWLWRGSAVSTEMKSLTKKIIQKFISEDIRETRFIGRGSLELLLIDENNEPIQFKQEYIRSKLTPEEKNQKPSWSNFVNFHGEVPEYELDEDENWRKTEQKSIVMSYYKAGRKAGIGMNTCQICGKIVVPMCNPIGRYMRMSPDRKWNFPPTFKHLVSSHNKKPPQELITDAVEWFNEDQKNVKRIIIKDGIINILNAKTEEERKKIEQLSLVCRELTSIPEVLFSLTSLKDLNLEDNQLTSIPEGIRNLTSLEKLDLAGNKISSLPENLGNLKSLYILNLCLNYLCTIPESIGNLTSLEILNLSGNQLTSLPENLGNLVSLYDLNLSGNQLTSLPESIGNLLIKSKSIQERIDQLVSIPDSLGLKVYRDSRTGIQYSVQPNLTPIPPISMKIDLSNNQLSSLPENIGNLTHLKELNLSDNELTSLPDSFGNLTALSDLFLSGNQLTTLPESFGSLKSLLVLNLLDNPLTSLPESFGNLTSLGLLYLPKNLLPYLPKSLTDKIEAKQVDSDECVMIVFEV